jgi:DNA-binding NtrC family response regulator
LVRDLTRTAPFILVIDDQTSFRIVVIKALREAGFNVIGAASADEAVVVLAARRSIDLILTDFKMPGSMNGLGLARFVRRARLGVKVVFLSADAADCSLRAWAHGFLSKPCDMGSIIKTVTNVLAMT